MVYEGGDHLNGKLWLRAAVWQHGFKVSVWSLGLLPPRLNGGPVCDKSAAEDGVCSQMWRYI